VLAYDVTDDLSCAKNENLEKEGGIPAVLAGKITPLKDLVLEE